MTKEEVHQRWSAMTDNGKNDSTVRDIELFFREFTVKLRARYQVSADVLSAIDSARTDAVHETKWHLIHGGKAPKGITR